MTAAKPSRLDKIRKTPRSVRLYVYGIGAAACPILAACHVLPAAAIPLALPMLLAILHLTGDTDG